MPRTDAVTLLCHCSCLERIKTGFGALPHPANPDISSLWRLFIVFFHFLHSYSGVQGAVREVNIVLLLRICDIYMKTYESTLGSAVTEAETKFSVVSFGIFNMLYTHLIKHCSLRRAVVMYCFGLYFALKWFLLWFSHGLLYGLIPPTPLFPGTRPDRLCPRVPPCLAKVWKIPAFACFALSFPWIPSE